MNKSHSPGNVYRSFNFISFMIYIGFLLVQLSCTKENPIQSPQSLEYQFKGSLYRLRLDTDPLPDTLIVPLKLRSLIPVSASVTLDGKTSAKSDSSWFCSFDFGLISEGQHTLHVDSTSNSTTLDTTFIINHNGVCTSDSGAYVFVVKEIPLRKYQFKGAIYRFRLDTDPPFDTTMVPENLRSLTPIQTTITLDGKTSVKSDSLWFCSFDFGLISEGEHLLHIESSLNSASFDTTILIDHDGECGSDIVGYNFTVKAVPTPKYRFVGAIYRYRLDFEPIDHNAPPWDLYRPLTPIHVYITLDNKYKILADSTWINSFDFGSIKAGKHSLHVDATMYTAPFDTTFIIERDYLHLGDFHIILQTIPPPTREFIFPSLVGTSWIYKYYYHYSYPVGPSSTTINGIHTWTIRSSTFNGATTTMLVDEIRKDTVDNKYTIDTVQFSITKSANIIEFNFPSKILDFKCKSIPRFHDYPTDTLKIISETRPDGYAIYISSTGLSYFTYTISANHSYTESISLINFIKP